MQTSGSVCVYRKPGAGMLLTEDGQMISAISAGCLEADILELTRLYLVCIQTQILHHPQLAICRVG